MDAEPSPYDLLRPRRSILGMTAVLLPFDASGRVDWDGLDGLLERTVQAGLVPAVNMDTSYVNLTDSATQDRVLTAAATATGAATSRASTGSRPDRFVAGAFVADRPGDPYDADAYARHVDAILAAGGTPVVFPSYGLSDLTGPDWVAAHRQLAPTGGRLIAFELGPQFVPFGRIVDLDTYEALLSIPEVVGAKHSSLDRSAEWDRLRLRDRVRPDFHVFTGNDLAIDMVCYGSDYLLGLSAMAPDAFARRDALWSAGDDAFHQLNDVLAHLGAFAFRDPVPGYKHNVAQFLALRGWIPHDEPHPDSPRRPATDRDVLSAALERLTTELERLDPPPLAEVVPGYRSDPAGKAAP